VWAWFEAFEGPKFHPTCSTFHIWGMTSLLEEILNANLLNYVKI
jgi:hypothetical protein